MSGLINSAGSKSGVIGTTELDYEEGTHTVVHAQTDGTSFAMNSGYQTLSYTKIGRVVHCTGYLVINTITGSPSHTKFTLPFTCASGNEHQGSQNAMTYGVDYGGDGVSIYVGPSQKYCQCISSRDDASYLHVSAAAGDEYAISITYYTND